MQQTQTIDILSEDFEMPVLTADLQDIIEIALTEYEDKPRFRQEKREFKLKLNELIGEYNERRDMHVYNYVR